jgi:hypothetical protein
MGMVILFLVLGSHSEQNWSEPVQNRVAEPTLVPSNLTALVDSIHLTFFFFYAVLLLEITTVGAPHCSCPDKSRPVVLVATSWTNIDSNPSLDILDVKWPPCSLIWAAITKKRARRREPMAQRESNIPTIKQPVPPEESVVGCTHFIHVGPSV